MKAATPSRKTSILCLLAATTVLTPLAFARPALAADAATAAEADADGALLGEVIVTATRRAESIQKVPISVQALSTEQLAERQVKGLSDIVSLLPQRSWSRERGAYAGRARRSTPVAPETPHPASRFPVDRGAAV